jgi:hypothetical protein
MKLEEFAKDDKELDEVLPAIGKIAGSAAKKAGATAGQTAMAVGRGVKNISDRTGITKVANVAGQALGKAIDLTNKVDNLSTSSMARSGQKIGGANAKYGDADFGNDDQVAAAQQDPAKKAQLKRDMQQALRDKEEQIRAIRDKMRELG